MADFPVRLGLAGCGLISHAHGRAARKSQYDVSFVACMSRSMESAQTWAAEYGCEHAYDNLDEMLASEELDGVVIASWPSVHCEQIIACIEAGVSNILCEKALVTNGAEALQVWHAASKAGAVVMEGFMYRHHPGIQRLEALSTASGNGPVDSIHAVFNMLDETREDTSVKGWRRRPDAGGGVAHDFLCYPVDAACHFAAAYPVRAQATGSFGPYGTIDRLAGLLEFSNGVFAVVESSRHANLNQRLEIRCANTTLAMPFAWSPPGDVHIDIMQTHGFLNRQIRTETIVLDVSHDGRLVDFPVFTGQMNNFVETILGIAEPLVSAEGAVVNAFVIDALLTSMESAKSEAVTLPGVILE
jgi:predicted dehydrogenase